ncbi:hypothetical protein ACFWNN_08140 [Lentzea sp. NPDC058450]|uniref:hypothetical protein n=1 Tax=Lentzea sp. NPDC058450 TaxID=3346505 RepID=UPI00364A86DA
MYRTLTRLTAVAFSLVAGLGVLSVPASASNDGIQFYKGQPWTFVKKFPLDGACHLVPAGADVVVAVEVSRVFTYRTSDCTGPEGAAGFHSIPGVVSWRADLAG